MPNHMLCAQEVVLAASCLLPSACYMLGYLLPATSCMSYAASHPFACYLSCLLPPATAAAIRISQETNEPAPRPVAVIRDEGPDVVPAPPSVASPLAGIVHVPLPRCCWLDRAQRRHTWPEAVLRRKSPVRVRERERIAAVAAA